MQQQTSRRWAVRTVLLLLTLFGLLAMHGLPDAMAGPTGAAPMPTGVSMSTMPVVASPITTHVARDALRAGTGAHQHAQPADAQSRSTNPSLDAPAGCGMDHGNCVAVLREAGHLAAAPAALATVPAATMPTRSAMVTPHRGPRAPPDVSLIGLGISRT